ncbi:rhodanese-like domain-containing protein [Maribacter sp. CXY002]|uniref:rhodanese-like domain-containing protein n=1 Tax=Maribacter luteocoastalis TaxID=3407671 RepID=UPI003B67BCCE
MSFISALFGSKKKETDRIAILNKEEYKEAIEHKNIQLVDVRTSLEYTSGHIKNALNIDFFNANTFQREFEKLDKDKPVYLYCRSGARSQKAAYKLLDMGFTKIYDLKGGYNNWR